MKNNERSAIIVVIKRRCKRYHMTAEVLHMLAQALGDNPKAM